jgi:hypothetical protein
MRFMPWFATGPAAHWRADAGGAGSGKIRPFNHSRSMRRPHDVLSGRHSPYRATASAATWMPAEAG